MGVTLAGQTYVMQGKGRKVKGTAPYVIPPGRQGGIQSVVTPAGSKPGLRAGGRFGPQAWSRTGCRLTLCRHDGKMDPCFATQLANDCRPSFRRDDGIGKALFRAFTFTLFVFTFALPSYASSGTEGAAFLDIPVGAGPAALGAAYTALAHDAYAPTYNPGGLGFLDSTQLAGQHLSYLDTLHYEYLSFVHPLTHTLSPTSGGEGVRVRGAIGASVQYLGSGDIAGADASGNPTGSFSSYFASYNLAYGRAFNEKLSLGMTGKLINAKIDDVSAHGYAVDLGSMYKLQPHLTLAATLTNLGSKLTFLNEGDPLPLAFHLGAAYQPSARWFMTTEGVYPKTGLASLHLGGEWRPLELIALRVGYRTDTTKELSVLAGFTTGLGLEVWGQELAYAWVPMGGLGNTHYVSLLMKFGEAERAQRNLIQYQQLKTHRTVKNPGGEDVAPEYQQLMELLNDSDQHLARQSGGLDETR